MTLSQDAVRLYEQDLLQKADMLAIGLKGLKSADPGRASALLVAISERLENAVLPDTPALAAVEPAAPGERQRPLLVASRGGGATSGIFGVASGCKRSHSRGSSR